MDYDEIPYSDFEDLPPCLRKRKSKTMKVRGIANWASVQAPNTTFEPVYQVDLTVSEESAAGLKNEGLNVKKVGEDFVYKFKRKQFKADGTENKKPVVVLADKTPFDGLIGNGSEVIVQFSTYEWKNKFGSGISADLQGVQVLNLVEYRAGDGEEFEDEANGGDDVIGGSPSKTAAPRKPAQAEFDDDLPDVL